MDKIISLQSERSTGTTLVSYYIPAGKDMSAVSAHIAKEQSQCTNIKSAQTRKSVQSALRVMKQNLKGSTRLPPTGMAIFASDQSYV